MSEVGSRPCSSIIFTNFLGTYFNLRSLVSSIMVTCDNSGLKTSFVNGYVNNTSTIKVLLYGNFHLPNQKHI